jgi:hypothetical protein
VSRIRRSNPAIKSSTAADDCERLHLAGRTLLAAAMINQVLTKTAIESLTDAVRWHAQAMVKWLASARGL